MRNDLSGYGFSSILYDVSFAKMLTVECDEDNERTRNRAPSAYNSRDHDDGGGPGGLGIGGGGAGGFGGSGFSFMIWNHCIPLGIYSRAAQSRHQSHPPQRRSSFKSDCPDLFALARMMHRFLPLVASNKDTPDDFVAAVENLCIIRARAAR